MDDNRTNKTLDSLADIFLTGGNGGAGATARDGHRKPDGQPVPRAPSSMLDAPAPMRLPPRPRAAEPVAAKFRPEPARPSSPTGATEQAVIGTIGRTATAERETPAGNPASHLHRVEAVLLGNLPGVAGPWLTQYAHWLAQRHGPVATFHLDDDELEVELVSTWDDPSLPPHQPSQPMHGGAAGNEALLDCLLDLSQLDPSPARTWLLHLPTPLTEAAIAKVRELPRWTILCGTDDAAVVSAYQLLKQLLEGDPEAAKRRVGVMMMGSDMASSRAAARKLNEAAASFLETPIHLTGAIKQMVPVAQRRCGIFTDPEIYWPSIRAFLETLPGKPLTLAAAPKVAVAPPPPPAPEPVAAAPAPTPVVTPPPAPVAEPPETEVPDLTTYLSGAIALQARCPRHPNCALALDEEGRIHLLLHCHAKDDLHAAVVALLETQAWVTEHRELIRMTQRQCQFDAQIAPVPHLFTNQAKTAARLAAHNAPQLRVHLLERVQAGQQSAWYCTELN